MENTMPKKLTAVVFVLIAGLATAYYFSPYYYFSPANREARLIDELVARNLAARGGAEAWQKVSSLRLGGLMDVGQEMYLPYLLEQKRPGKMCLEFTFDDQVSVQCTDGQAGWKIAPFRGSTAPAAMTDKELRETADATDLYGLLYNHAARGIRLELAGHEPIDGRDTYKLKVTLPQGAVRWLYLDAETALEVKFETVRNIAGHERRVETVYRDWKPVEGLLISRRQDTLTEGDKASHFITVDKVEVNPPLDDARFAMPTTAEAGRLRAQQVSF
jgi:hypothetical protein